MSNHELAIIDGVQARINDLVAKGDLELPPGYAPGNAVREAYLILKEAVDRNKRPVLEVCTQESIALSLLNMVVLGLSPARKQVYFIPYGSKLTMMPSYLGNLMTAKRLNPHVRDIRSEVILEGDEVVISLNRGQKVIERHVQQFKTPTIDVIAGAYSMAIGNSGEVLQTVVMTKEEIFKSWAQSRQKPFDDRGNLKPNTVHAKFPQEMCKRTTANRLCKMLISTAVPPESFLNSAIQEIEVEAADAELEAAIAEHAGQTMISFDNQPTPTPNTEKKTTRRTRKKKETPAKETPAQEEQPAPQKEMALEVDDNKVSVSQQEPQEEPLPTPEEIPEAPAQPEDPFDPGF